MDLEAEHDKLKAQCKFQERRIEELEQVRDGLETCFKELQEERDHITTKSDALERAIIIMSEEGSGMRAQIQDLEDERQMLLFKYQAQQDAIVTIKRESDVSFSNNRRGSLMIDVMEDDRERLAAKCTSQESRILTLEKELASKEEKALDSALQKLNAGIQVLEDQLEKSLTQCQSAAQKLKQTERIVGHMKAFTDKVEDERDQLDFKCKSQEELISILEKHDKASLAGMDL